jgi:hypothetical protein
MIALIYPFLALAVAGFIALAAIHIASLLGVTYPFDHFLQFLAPGIFVTFIPTIFVMNRLTRDFKQKDLWRAALRGCPQWMRWTVWVVFGYTWLGFFVLPLLYGGGMETTANKARSMSGVLMVFYLIPAAVYTGSALGCKQAMSKRPPSLAIRQVLRRMWCSCCAG